MARAFSAAGNDYIVTGTITSFTQRSVSVMVHPTDYAVSQGRVWEWRDAGGSLMNMQLYNTGSANVCEVAVNWSTTTGVWTCPPPSAGSWHVVTVTYDGGSTSNNPAMYVDGVSQTVTRAIAPAGSLNAGTRSMTFGQRFGGSGNKYNGAAAEFGLWNRILTAGELAGLAKWSVPNTCPRGLISYYPLLGRYSPELDLAPGVASGSGTVTSTSIADHPRVFRVFNPMPVMVADAASGPGVPVFLHHYAQHAGAM